jgi:hypothetical protein
VLEGQVDVRTLATPILAALALGSLIGAGAIRVVADSRFVRRAMQRPILHRFVMRSEGNGDAWCELTALAAGDGPAELLGRAPAALAAALKSAAHLAFATPSRYEALVRMLGHGGEKDDLETILGHELNQAGLRPTTEDQFRAELRFRESRDRLRGRAMRRLEALEAELVAVRARVAGGVALTIAPWPAFFLVGFASPTPAALAVATAIAAAMLSSLLADRRARPA